MSVMRVISYNKNGEEIKTKETMLLNDNVYKILKKYIQKPIISKTTTNTDKVLVKV